MSNTPESSFGKFTFGADDARDDRILSASAAGELTFAADAAVNERADFVTKTYLHLLGAVMAFAGIEAILLTTPELLGPVLSLLTIPYGALLLIGGFILVSYVAERWARSATSLPLQYAGLSLYVLAEAVIFAPLLFLASTLADDLIPAAAVITMMMFTGLTAIVFLTRKNFSFLGPALGVAGMAALGLIVCSLLFGFGLGVIFSVGMIAFACGWILYDTSKVLHEYQIGQHVAASLALFASVALLFWYVIRLLMYVLDRD